MDPGRDPGRASGRGSVELASGVEWRRDGSAGILAGDLQEPWHGFDHVFRDEPRHGSQQEFCQEFWRESRWVGRRLRRRGWAGSFSDAGGWATSATRVGMRLPVWARLNPV